MTRLSTCSSPLRWLAAFAWSVLLCILLLQAESAPLIDLGLPRGENTLARELAFSALHWLAFCLTCCLWFFALSTRFSLGTGLLLAGGIALVLGGTTELLQSYTLDRHTSWLDLMANISGTLIAALAIWRWQRRRG